MRLSLTMVLAIAALGCNGGTNDVDATTNVDASTNVDANGVDAPSGVDAGRPTDAGAGCGTAMPAISRASGTEGLAIARDGTIYYSVSGGVARIGPDGVMNESWLSAGGAGSTIWGLALDATNTHLFIGDPTTGQLRVATGLAGTPTQVPLAAIAQPNGVTVGPDGAVYVSDFGNDTVLRVDATSGAITTVTASPISGANGVAFTNDGHLLVDGYNNGVVFSLTLDAAHRETARTMVARSVPNADGVAIDENGTLYIGGGSRVYRIGPGGTPDMTLQMGRPGTANLEWGAGPLNCHDLYVATGTGLTRIPLPVGQRAVLWH